MLRLVDQPRPIAWWAMRFVSERYKHYYAQRNLPDWQRIAARRTLYLHECNTLYMINAKAASSSLTGMMRDMGRLAAARRGYGRSALLGLPVHWQRLIEACLDPEVYRFTFVRHPVSRAVSSFFNLFVDRRNGFEWRHTPYLKRTGLKFGDDTPANFDRFLAYIEEVQAENEVFCDVHLRLQTFNIGARHIRYARIGHIETMRSDLDQVLAESGIGGLFDETMLKWANKSSARHETFSLDAAQRRKLEQLYAEDFQRFGY